MGFNLSTTIGQDALSSIIHKAQVHGFAFVKLGFETPSAASDKRFFIQFSGMGNLNPLTTTFMQLSRTTSMIRLQIFCGRSDILRQMIYDKNTFADQFFCALKECYDARDNPA